jgi:Holliday junction DNA helicase RuvA
MIGRLQGKVLEKTPPFFILDVSGIGFMVQTPLSSFKRIEEHQEVVVYTKCLIKDEEAYVYGFLNRDELDTFVCLISVPGVGPKSALNLLSSFSPDEITRAIESENVELLSSVTKVGKKLASKIILELKGKLSLAEKPTPFKKAITALCKLGLTRSEAIERLKGLPENLSLEELVRQALRK